MGTQGYYSITFNLNHNSLHFICSWRLGAVSVKRCLFSIWVPILKIRWSRDGSLYWDGSKDLIRSLDLCNPADGLLPVLVAMASAFMALTVVISQEECLALNTCANFVDIVGAYMPCQAGRFVAMKFWKWKSKETHCGLWRRKHIVIRQLFCFQWYIFKMQQMHTIKADYDQQSLLETTVLFVRVVIYGNASILMIFRYVARMTTFQYHEWRDIRWWSQRQDHTYYWPSLYT